MRSRKQTIPPTLCVLVLALLLVGCRNSGTLDMDYGAGDATGSMLFGGLERTYRVHVPPSHDKTKPAPLVLALHGGGGTGAHMERLTLGGFNVLSDQEGFIVAYPDGIERHWNDGRKQARDRAHGENIDDVGFLSALIDRLIQELNVDAKRIYVTGMSNGAMMSFRLACERSGKIAAIAPVAGAMPDDLAAHCAPLQPISVLVISNTQDPMVPWTGGDVRFLWIERGKAYSTASTVAYWVRHDQCSPSPVVAWEPDADPQDGTRVRREVYGGGKDETEVILYAIEGGGHTWPGGYQYLPEGVIGKTSRDIDANQVIWDFFKRHAIGG